ncbi:MAG: hypothetical protein A3D74_01530 [Candidatus Levybacteria bacterium RIFCSPHIGHO2_02_FULL_37_13]|nr:MAG: hypothetical protein A3D74_01530 [Candidatus Levybacteria bacterium RIFCSPHIGHO2_02_FULL_37_13]OGH29983.1 MAG: hypothetical protein A3E40_04950 [Candidatus Levybacteria bacterium RIFCSPHIGHO2_12_FULL_37_9]
MINQKLKLKNSPALLDEIKNVLKSVSFGSVEIYVQNSKVTQLTVRKILKTKYDIGEEDIQETIQINQKQSVDAQNRVLTKKKQ